MAEFEQEVTERLAAVADNRELLKAGQEFMRASNLSKYSYNYFWLGRPIIQYPQDIAAMQELIWQIKPDLIIETGIAHGGSLIFSASMLSMLDYCEAVENGALLDPKASRRHVLGIDIDIRAHNRKAIEAHPMASRIQMIQGSSIDPGTIDQVRKTTQGYKRILVCLDSNHTHDHVLAELEAYAPLVSIGSYCVVFDTIIENLPGDMFPDRPWGKGDNPKTAVREYLDSLALQNQTKDSGKGLTFQIDKELDDKLMISVAPQGYLRRIC